MRYEVAPYRLFIWFAPAVVGWAVVIGVCLYLPQALVLFAVAGGLLWRKGRRPVALPHPVGGTCTEAQAGAAAAPRDRNDVRQLVPTGA